MHSYAFNRSAPISYIGRTQNVLKLIPSCIINLSYPRVSVLPEGEEFANHRFRNIMSGPNLVETKQFTQFFLQSRS